MLQIQLFLQGKRNLIQYFFTIFFSYNFCDNGILDDQSEHKKNIFGVELFLFIGFGQTLFNHLQYFLESSISKYVALITLTKFGLTGDVT